MLIKGKAIKLHKCNTNDMKSKITARFEHSESLDMNNIYYHKRCSGVSKTGTKKTQIQNSNEDTRSFLNMKRFVIENIIKKEQVFSLSDLYEIYTEDLIRNNQEVDPNLRGRHYMLAKLKTSITNLSSVQFNKKTYVLSKSLSVKKVLEEMIPKNDETSLKTISFKIRKEILSMEKNYFDVNTCGEWILILK